MKKSTNTSQAEKRCIFCQATGKMSKEHIWGDWLKQYIPPKVNKHHLNAQRMMAPNVPTISELKLRAGDPLRSSVRVVCINCNNTWLSQIQNQAKTFLIPLILGKKVILDEKAQKIVATWCTMAAMTAEFIDRDGAVAISQAEREWLWKNSSVPDNWRIWIGRYQRYKWPGQWIHLTAPLLGAKDIPGFKPGDHAPPNTQTTTFVIGELYVHVFSTTGDPRLVSTWAWPLGSSVSRLLMQIWPSKESFIAWPTESLKDHDADFIPTALDKIIDIASRSITGRRLF